MQKKIKSALISVFYKEGLENIILGLQSQGVAIYSTGGTQKFIEEMEVRVMAVETLTSYPSILGGRVKTLHPKIFGGILARRGNPEDILQLEEYAIPAIDLVIVDLYPFEETLRTTGEEQKIIEKIDIGGVSLIRAAGKNFQDVVIIASRQQYPELENILIHQQAETSLLQRKSFAAKAFLICSHYDDAISHYFNPDIPRNPFEGPGSILRYGENPHQKGIFYGDLSKNLQQVHGKELSYNNLVDIDAACQLIAEFPTTTFAVIKHTNVCGVASRNSLAVAWEAALAGDQESAFGGVLICNQEVDKATAVSVNEIFFEILIAPGFDPQALEVLKTKKNRILLLQSRPFEAKGFFKPVLNGVLAQDNDHGNFKEWKEVARPCSPQEKTDLEFANIICKHLKSNAISLVKNAQLVGKGCGQTSRIDALRQALNKAAQFGFDLKGAVMASDAFFPFDDCVRIADEAGISAIIQPGGSIRDKDSITYCQEHDLAMVITGTRHFRH
ncbi:MAG: bifunctional phosphoribosylaminoimidazolecarboxamide formyltransferase/IMP cyclohydrolase [Chitinophagaceae bacterium]